MTTKTTIASVMTLSLVLGLTSTTRCEDTDPSSSGPATQSASTMPAGDSAAASDKDILLTSRDGTMILTLPAEWSQTKPQNPRIIIKAESTEGSICVFSSPKVDIVSFEAFVNVVHKHEVSAIKNVYSTDATELTIGGRPVIRYDITYNDGVYKWGYMELFVETSTRYNEFTVMGLRSVFDSRKEQWVKLVAGLSEKPTAPRK